MDQILYGALSIDDPDNGFVALAEGLDFGGPEPLTTALPRVLLDGEDIAGDRSSNKAIQFLVAVSGSDQIELNEREALLVAEVEKRSNTLVRTVPDPSTVTVPALHRTFRGKLRQRFDIPLADLREAGLIGPRPTRIYEVSCPALPYVSSLTATVASGLDVAASASTTVIDACDATTGWSVGSHTLSVNTSSFVTSTGSLSSTDSAYLAHDNGDGTWTLTYTTTFTKTFSPVDQTTQKYLQLALSYYSTLSATATVDGQDCPLVSVVNEPTSPWRRVTFKPPISGWTTLRVVASTSTVVPSSYSFPATMSLGLDDVRKSNQPGASTTPRASMFSVPVDGSVRTPVSLELSHATSALGNGVQVFTCEDLDNGFRPDNRRYRTAGGTVSVDGSATSGSSEPVLMIGTTGTPVFSPPATTLAPGSYAVYLRLRRGSTGSETLVVRAQTRFGANSLSDLAEIRATTTFTSSGTYQMVYVGTVYLPRTVVSDSSSAVVDLTIGTVGGGSITLDDLFLYPRSGVLTQIDCGTSTPAAGGDSNRIWLDNATLTGSGGVYVGHAADKSDARFAGSSLGALGTHVFKPPRTLVWVLTPNANAAQIAATYFAQWYLNPAA